MKYALKIIACDDFIQCLLMPCSNESELAAISSFMQAD